MHKGVVLLLVFVITALLVVHVDGRNREEEDPQLLEGFQPTGVPGQSLQVKKLQRALSALRYAREAENRAAGHEQALGGAKLSAATSTAREAAKLIHRANSLIRSERALKSEQVRSAPILPALWLAILAVRVVLSISLSHVDTGTGHVLVRAVPSVFC